jgi:hypothetical protein
LEEKMMARVRWFLFETRLGDRLLALFERLTGLVVVEVESLESEAVVLTRVP